jgi:chemotaxis protein methyltransferase WspC
MNQKPPGVVERLLAERIGLDPTSVGETLIARGVHVRMAALGVRSKADYERILMENLDERQALVEEVVVPESWFFRDEKPFEVLARFAQDWFVDRGRPPLTVLSIPCASGEEPYSIAMTLLEAGLPADRFRVDAVDVSARSLARAIAGVYGSNAFRGEASARRSSYFREQSGSFTLDLAVRSAVRFHLGNLLDPALLADRGPFDVVFCRNLLIYLDDESNARAFASLNRLVGDGGLLFLGHADRMEAVESSPFEPMADKGAFAYRKGLIPSPGPVSRGAGLAPPITQGRQGKPYPTEKDRAGLPPQVEREAQTPKPVVTVASESLLDRASSLADSGQYDEASSLVEQAVAAGLANARAYFLMGMIAQASDLREPAEKHYQKAIYLDPQHDEALLALALLARRKGDVAAEAGYRRRAERVRSRKVNP